MPDIATARIAALETVVGELQMDVTSLCEQLHAEERINSALMRELAVWRTLCPEQSFMVKATMDDVNSIIDAATDVWQST